MTGRGRALVVFVALMVGGGPIALDGCLMGCRENARVEQAVPTAGAGTTDCHHPADSSAPYHVQSSASCPLDRDALGSDASDVRPRSAVSLSLVLVVPLGGVPVIAAESIGADEPGAPRHSRIPQITPLRI